MDVPAGASIFYLSECNISIEDKEISLGRIRSKMPAVT